MGKALALFAGAGGTTLGQRLAGNEVVACIEYAPAMAATLRANFPYLKVVEQDVRTVDFTQFRGDLDVLVGGPPCQPFSQAGNNNGEYDPRDMIPEYIRAVRETRPRMFIMEEVQTLTWKRHRGYLDRVLADLRALGYEVDWQVINMADYGIPQARKRLFVIGRNDGESVAWPLRMTGDRVTMAEALGWDEDTCAYRNSLTPNPGGDYLWPMRRPAMTVVGSFRPDVMAAPGYRKAGDGPRQNTPGSVVITLTEAKILQGLPRNWIIEGSESEQWLQVGNSCPPAMTSLLTRANR